MAVPLAPAWIAMACGPPRYKITEDGLICLGSEVGLLVIDDAKVVEKGSIRSR